MAVDVAQVVERVRAADDSWKAAVTAHILAPPDAGFPVRLRGLAVAAEQEAEAMRFVAEAGIVRRPKDVVEPFHLAPELTPGMNRPGPQPLWDRFDRTVATLAQALAGTSNAELADAFQDLSEAAGAIASELTRRARTA